MEIKRIIIEVETSSMEEFYHDYKPMGAGTNVRLDFRNLEEFEKFLKKWEKDIKKGKA